MKKRVPGQLNTLFCRTSLRCLATQPLNHEFEALQINRHRCVLDQEHPDKQDSVSGTRATHIYTIICHVWSSNMYTTSAFVPSLYQ